MNRNTNTRGYIEVGEIEVGGIDVWPYYYELMPEGWWEALALDISIGREHAEPWLVSQLYRDLEDHMFIRDTDPDPDMGREHSEFDCQLQLGRDDARQPYVKLILHEFVAPTVLYSEPLDKLAGFHPFFDALIQWQAEHPDADAA